ncbi:MAG: hypothetical protein KBD76_08465 [Bacteriovorax sp.]|jgi:hypothetical protein|nr:hypothetical protein [Bacteriovorax sp.]
MAAPNFLIMNLLRLITPEEIGDIATKHNGGKFLSLTDLVNERVERQIYRDFSSPDSMEEIHDAHSAQAKILPFNKKPTSPDSNTAQEGEALLLAGPENEKSGNTVIDKDKEEGHTKEVIEHKEDENMSSFIMIEKARLKRSQRTLKQKEIIDLYQKNSNVEVEQIKASNSNLGHEQEAGVLVNKKQY